VPELPEVETVRAGLDRWVLGRTIAEVSVRHPRVVRRHPGGADDLAAQLVGTQFAAACRRGKYLWLPLRRPGEDTADRALVAHLGMSGQWLVADRDAAPPAHLHLVIRFADGGRELRFCDQRTFGGVLVDSLVPTRDRAVETVPACIGHIARDPLDPAFDDEEFSARLRRRNSAVKRALLDQGLVSGVGNIYADESLWRARLHGERLGTAVPRARAGQLLAAVRAVLTEALAAGGTSFDALYVDVNGQSGYFDRALAVYGREGLPCTSCGSAVRRSAFMNRSSFWCPRCQRLRGTAARVPRNIG
jgi:formamidopyrimidine-DNA glycosylase